MNLKPGVILDGISTEMLHACSVVNSVFQYHGLTCTMTSGLDGKHKDDSLHYKGRAGDFRTRDVPQNLLPLVVNNIRQKLGPDYDVILEDTHLHIEYDPKG